jgi:organic hydroperoxide reductase OsmC/OhrA
MSETDSFTITLQQEQDYSFRVRFEDTEAPDLLTDEPAPLGKAEGPNPSRLLVAAVANCMAASLLFALRKYKNEPGLLSVRATARMGRNADGRMRVQGVEAEILLPELAGSYAQLERILAQFEDFCVVTQSVRTGLPVAVRVRDAAGVCVHGAGAAQ